MAIVALTTGDTFEFVSKKDPSRSVQLRLVDASKPELGKRDEVVFDGNETKFDLASLDVFLMGHIYDSASTLRGKQGSDEIGIHTHVNKTNIDAVRFGLKGASNWLDARGNPQKVTFTQAIVNGREYQVADDDTLQRLGLQLIAEMAEAIKAASEVQAEAEKNSGLA